MTDLQGLDGGDRTVADDDTERMVNLWARHRMDPKRAAPLHSEVVRPARAAVGGDG